MAQKNKYLDEQQVKKLLKGAAQGQFPQRDYTLILLAYHHGLRSSEAINLHWENVDLEAMRLQFPRAKRGTRAYHPIFKSEAVALRKLRKCYPRSVHLFPSKHGEHLSPMGLRHIIHSAALRSSLQSELTAFHILRHSCGFSLAERGYSLYFIQDWLGHRDPKSTTMYVHQRPGRFSEIWE